MPIVFGRRSGSPARGNVMTKTIGLIAVLGLVVVGCSAAAEPGPPAEATTGTPGLVTTTTTTAPTPTRETTSTSVETTTSTQAPTTTLVADSTTTTAVVAEMNPPDVETWWCTAIKGAAAAGTAPEDFARDFDDEFRHGYTDAPVETIGEAADQLGRVQCAPDYAAAVIAALAG